MMNLALITFKQTFIVNYYCHLISVYNCVLRVRDVHSHLAASALVNYHLYFSVYFGAQHHYYAIIYKIYILLVAQY